MRSSLLAAALLVMTTPSWAEDVQTPDPALSPAEVVEIQLTALQRTIRRKRMPGSREPGPSLTQTTSALRARCRALRR